MDGEKSIVKLVTVDEVESRCLLVEWILRS